MFKRIFLLIFYPFLILNIVYSQEFKQVISDNNALSYPQFLKGLTVEDSIHLVNIPSIDVPDLYKSINAPVLPASVDNSLLSYFRPITWQLGYECGQTAGIAFVFTYEINRLRNISSNIPNNQYPTHFSWNFLNDAYNYKGVSFFDTWEITRMCGNPNIVEYGGGLGTGGEKRWMTGYQEYYNSMKNRISGAYSIRCDTPEELEILKHWLHNHLEDATTGGIGCLYAQYCSPNTTLPSGTPESGKALISTWGNSPSHAWTVAGYNDSIRYDYNNDGQYTNNIDINGDGIVNMKDWEIGGLKLANGYAGPGWGNGGFAYMMYKSLAETINNGGIWNHTVYVVKAKLTQNPQLVFKINMKHDKRNQIKVIAGINTNTNADKPSVRLEFPIINFHGDALGMQGDTTEASKSIEFGLDITPLLSYINSGQAAKYFLEVIEKDPIGLGTGTGFVNALSLMDYTSGSLIQTNYPINDVFITNNDTTRLSITKNVIFDKPNILNDSMLAKIYEPYNRQLNATQGTPPYKWSLIMDYTENITTAAFPNISNQQLNTSVLGYAVKNLNFSFPFFGNSYDKIYVYPNGFIKFDNSIYHFPYIIDADLLFRSHKLIAPFWDTLSYGTGLGIWCTEDAHSITVRWKARKSGQSGSNVNVALKLYDTGKIEFYYGAINITGNWFSGLSGGDVLNYFISSLSNTFTDNTNDRKIEFTPPDYPKEMQLSEDGLFEARPDKEHNTHIKVKVTDNNNITNEKTIPFKTCGLMLNYTYDSGGDSIINPGDTVYLTATIKNINPYTLSNGSMLIQTQDSLITLLDSTAIISSIIANDSIILPDIFHFVVSEQIMDAHEIILHTKINTSTDTFNITSTLYASSFLLAIGNITYLDGNNNILDVNETAAMMVEIKNMGGAPATNLNIHISSNDPYITLNPNTTFIDTLLANNSENAFFIITTAFNTPSYHIAVLNITITGNNNYQYNTYLFIEIGTKMEDFETADFTQYAWTHSGTENWFITDSTKYEGIYAARSGIITHNQTSSLSINHFVLNDGFVKFHKKVSCERDNTNHNWDYLAFYIDGTEKGRWDGEIDWSQEIFPVSAGNHTYKWTYVKDYSVSTGSDCAWLDNIIFPLYGDPNPTLSFNPPYINKTINLNTIDSAEVFVTNNGSDLVVFDAGFSFSGSFTTPWLQCPNPAATISAADTRNIKLFFNSQGLLPGNYFADMKITYNIDNQTIIPVQLIVNDNTFIQTHTSLNAGLLCFPNPLTNNVYITYFIDTPADTEINIYDSKARNVRKLLKSTHLNKGNYTLFWDITDDEGNELPSGMYVCKLTHGNSFYTQKLIVTY